VLNIIVVNHAEHWQNSVHLSSGQSVNSAPVPQSASLWQSPNPTGGRDDLPDGDALHIFKRETWAPWLCGCSRGRQVRPLLTLATILLDHRTLLTTFFHSYNLDVQALLDRLLETRDHRAQGAELVKSEIAVEDGFLGLAIIEAALEAVDEGHCLFRLRLFDLLADGLDVEVGVGFLNEFDISARLLV
jgi:hypothetical protein